MPLRYISVLMVMTLSVILTNAKPDEALTKATNDEKVTAPVVYEDLMLVLVSAEGAAAVIFNGENKRETKYRYRYESKDGKTAKSGEGKVFEKEEINRPEDLMIQAGPIEVEWSPGGDGRGWIYYVPEKVKVHLANAEKFQDGIIKETGTPVKKLDLRRYMK